ncbi:DUF5786 family protein [Halopelagius longus]|uniref:Death domain-associated protein n=1 Tax=Halopelagius longus TaxID=1236180 RepID=A0A1H1GIV4_9EURY|nr:DUF5786 family protein [Halopelagius longus]RDI69732.1 death domain-associated protein [Halopelagius longus]SDR12798.1 hypothetical protein SAMN05216278_3683 [Halopelagius longus]
MGFGSYDESEQQQPTDNDDDDGEGVSVHENDHDGSVSVESDVSTDDLVSRLGEMRDDEEDEE